MAYVAVEPDGNEYIFNEKPSRYEDGWWNDEEFQCGKKVLLPSGSIEKLIGYKLTWKNKPVELINSK